MWLIDHFMQYMAGQAAAQRHQAIREAEQRIIADEANEYSVFGMLDTTESDKARHKREVDEMAQRLQDETEMRMGMWP